MLFPLELHFLGQNISKTDNSVIEIINTNDKQLIDQLRKYGVKLDGDEILIATNNTELSKIYKSTKWADSWSKSLLRIDNAKFGGNKYFGKKSDGKAIQSGVTILPLNIVKQFSF